MNKTEKVSKFMLSSEQAIGKNLGENLPILLNRLEWLEEEVRELRKAVEEENLIEILDAFADIEYIHIGNLLTFGATEIHEKVFDEVHRSNMTKTVNGKVLRREDGKIIKPDTYVKPDIKSIVDEATR
jgi:predicted HAD superfamily Cof-like phosphohydrolase